MREKYIKATPPRRTFSRAWVRSLLCHTIEKVNLEEYTISFTGTFSPIFFSVFTETSQLEMFLLHQIVL